MKPANHLRVNERKIVVLSILNKFDGKTGRQIYELMQKNYPDLPAISFLTFYNYLHKWKHYKTNNIIAGKRFRGKVRWHITEYGKAKLEELLLLQSHSLPLKLKYPVRVIEHSSGKTKWIKKRVIMRDEKGLLRIDYALIDKSNAYMKQLIIDKRAREERQQKATEEIERQKRLAEEKKRLELEERNKKWDEEEKRMEAKAKYRADQEKHFKEFGWCSDYTINKELEEAKEERERERRRRLLEEPDWY